MLDKKHIRTFRSKKLHPEHVKLLNEAIRKNVKGGDHNVKITYRKESGEVSERRIKPLGVKQKDLLLAHCHERNAVRSFKIGRISKMEKSAFWTGFEKRATSFMQSGITSLQNAFGGGASTPPPAPPPPPPPASTSSKGARMSAGFKGVM